MFGSSGDGSGLSSSLVTMRSALAVLLAIAAVGCTPQGDPAIGADGFTDDFERDAVGDLWNDTGGRYRIEEGQLHVRGARNRPLWLRRRLPRDVAIEVDARSESQAGDIKLEVFGDGRSRATSNQYTATSYVIVFGGWNNSANIIARMDEHADDRAVGPRRPVEQGHTYRLRIERRGNTITAWADDQELATMDDPSPLEGRGHDHFGFNNWESDLWFDNLTIRPL